MPYVLRGLANEIVSLTRWPVAGEAVEFLDESHPDVSAFRNRPVETDTFREDMITFLVDDTAPANDKAAAKARILSRGRP